MLSRSHKYLAALALMPLAAGCVQATRHSNTMVFGTNTTIGLKVGQGVNQVPQIMVAYDRQEAVLMPLLANTRERGATEGLLSPCEPLIEREIISERNRTVVRETMIRENDPVEAMIHPCKFVGVRGESGKLTIQDSYSVLASFGARIEGEAAKSKGTVGLAQYFATGVAAQILAATGGASVVAVGQAAERSAENPNNANATAAVLGADYAAPLIDRETALLKIIDGPWKCGDPKTKKSEFDAIIANAKLKRPRGAWEIMALATDITEARDLARRLVADDIEQFIASQKEVCGG